MDWARILAYVTGTVDQELLARKEYLAAEKDARARRRLNRRSSIRLSVPTRKRPRTSVAGESCSTIAATIVSRDPKRGGREGAKVGVANTLR